MKRNKLAKYLAFAKGSILETFSYKFSIFGWVIGDFIEMLVVCFLWIAIYKYSPTNEINGFTMPLMIAYVIYARVVSQLTYASESFWIIGDDIREGNIAINLIKPINYRYRLLSGDIGYYLGRLIMVFIPIFVVALFALHFTVGTPFPIWYNFLFFILSSFLSLIIYSLFNSILGQLAFFTGALFGIGIMRNAIIMFLSGGAIPLSFFPDWCQRIFKFLPFPSMLETPNMIIMNKYDIKEVLIKILIQIFWILVMNLLASLTYKRSIKHVSSVGG